MFEQERTEDSEGEPSVDGRVVSGRQDSMREIQRSSAPASGSAHVELTGIGNRALVDSGSHDT